MHVHLFPRIKKRFHPYTDIHAHYVVKPSNTVSAIHNFIPTLLIQARQFRFALYKNNQNIYYKILIFSCDFFLNLRKE